MRIPRALTLLASTAFHLIWRMHNREYRLGPNPNKRLYLKCVLEDMKKKVNENEFVIYGYCIMSNHIHQLGEMFSESKALSEHMRRAHSRFANKLNRREKRSGAVANDRPKTKPIEDVCGQMRVLLYILTNPVRAGITKDPKHLNLALCSSCRFLAYGETNEYTDLLTLPSWYIALGKTPKKRQAKFRALLDQYLVKSGLKRDPKLSDGLYIGSKEWADKMLAEAREYRRRKTKGELDPVPLL